MEDFIGNNAKIIVEWGQWVAGAIIIAAILLLYLLVRNNRYYLPKGLLGYSTAIVLTIVALVGTLVFVKVTTIKPRMATVITGLESLRGKPAPDFNFRLLADDSQRSIRDYQGQVVLLNYWATWCAPCLKELPELDKLQENYRDEGLSVIALSDEGKDRLTRFAAKRPMAVTVAYSKEFTWADIQSERPISFLIDKAGTVVDYFTGGYSYEFFEKNVVKYLKPQ